MVRKILIFIGVLLVLLVVAYFYLDHRNRTLSPPGSASISSGDLKVEVTYSRPSVRDRLIFGTEIDGALVPYGKYWRLGANEATEITFHKDVLFNGQPIPQGVYRMYAFPGKESFDIRLNTQVGEWGASEPDYDQDIISTQVPVQSNIKVEQFTINLEETASGVDVIILWDTLRLTIPISKQEN